MEDKIIWEGVCLGVRLSFRWLGRLSVWCLELSKLLCLATVHCTFSACLPATKINLQMV